MLTVSKFWKLSKLPLLSISFKSYIRKAKGNIWVFFFQGTYREHDMFRERYNGRQQALFHVLAAYSVYNSEVGYCQGKYKTWNLMAEWYNIIVLRWATKLRKLRNLPWPFQFSGMSQIAALLLMYLIDEEDAFWALSQLMVDNKYAMHGKL